MDEFTQAAVKKYAELNDELKALENKKAMIEGQVKGLVSFLRSANAIIPGEIMPEMKWPAVSSGIPKPRIFISKKDVIGKEVERMLKRQQPQMTRELLEQLGEIGIRMNGSDPVVALSAVLSRDSRFVASRKDGWSLQEKTPDADDIGDLI